MCSLPIAGGRAWPDAPHDAHAARRKASSCNGTTPPGPPESADSAPPSMRGPASCARCDGARRRCRAHRSEPLILQTSRSSRRQRSQARCRNQRDARNGFHVRAFAALVWSGLVLTRAAGSDRIETRIAVPFERAGPGTLAPWHPGTLTWLVTMTESLAILVTGGTFDKKYDELTGRLFFRDTHVVEMLRLGRSRLEVVGRDRHDGRQPRHGRCRPGADRGTVRRADGAIDRRHPRHRHDGRDRARDCRGPARPAARSC